MPIIKRTNIPADDPQYAFDGWPEGLNTYQPKNKIKKTAMSAAQNVEIFINSVDKRLGGQYVGNAKDSRTRGLCMYTHSDGTKKIMRSSATTLQEYNPTTGDYDDVIGKTYTSDLNTEYCQAYDNLYIFNGTDALTKYNKDDSPKITVFTQIGPPTSPTGTRGGGLSDGQYTAHFKLTHYNTIGETTGTSEFTTTYNKVRSAWNGTTESIALAWTNDAGLATTGGTNIYFADTSGDETFLDTVSGTGTAYTFQGGTQDPDAITEVPETNSTGGVIAVKGIFDGVRLWCFSGSTLYWTGGGPGDIDHFDSSSGGGAVNVAKGDGDEIMDIKSTRDGKLVIYKQFSIWQSWIDTSGIINLKLSNPLIGAVGHRAVTVVDDDQVFISRQGVYKYGNQPNFPTDIYRIQSISFPVDKELEKVTPTNLSNMVIHYDNKKRLRIAYTEGGSTYNNKELVFKYGSWVTNAGLHINCYLNFTDASSGTATLDEVNKQYLLFGADDEGKVVQLDKGYSDMGNSIDAYFDTMQDDQGAPERYKKYYDQDVEVYTLQGNLDIYQYFDSGTDVKVTIDRTTIGGMGAEAVGLSSVGKEYGTLSTSTGVSINKRWRLFGRQQKHIRTRFQHNAASGMFSITRFSGVYREKSRRQYNSDDLLTTTEV